jgi:hypothetical protein
MEKEFVPYKESLELRNLGFDEPTLYHWHNSEKNHPLTNEIYFPGCQPSTNSGIKDIGNENHVWSAPLYQQAFRWFREKHGLYHYITTHDSTDFEWYVYDKDQNDWEDDTTQNTPEEAELACLGKLINIVKDGN